MLNRVVLVGRMTRNPELRRINSGAAVTSFTLALNRNFTSGDGQQADYINCVVWNKIAENVEKYCTKGSLVGVEGRLQSRSYDNAQGQKVYVVEVVCDSVQFLESRNARERNESNQGTYVPQNNQQQYAQPQQNFQQNQYAQPQQSNTQYFNVESKSLEQEFGTPNNSYTIIDEDVPF